MPIAHAYVHCALCRRTSSTLPIPNPGNATEDCRRREEDSARWEEAFAEEQARRDATHELRVSALQEHLSSMKGWIERNQAREDERVRRSEQLTLVKFTESEDIEPYLTTFERMMRVHEVEENRWAFKLAPQLPGKAQQAYAALSPEAAASYPDVKAAIPRRDDINVETYRRHFQSAKRKEGEAYMELVTRLLDLMKKWMNDCNTVEAMTEKIVIEQLLNTKPRDLSIWVSKRKPKTGDEAGRLADDYMQARCLEFKGTTKEPHEHQKDGSQRSVETRKCFKCQKEGHLTYNCPKKKDGTTETTTVKKEYSWRIAIRCFNSGNHSHRAM